MTDELRAGVYRHYKGPLYQVLGLAHDANADDLYEPTRPIPMFDDGTPEHSPLGQREVVVYMALQLDEAHPGARLAVRTLEDFFAWVHVSRSRDDYGTVCRSYGVHSRNGTFCHCDEVPGRNVAQRFTYVGLRYTA